MRIVSLGEHDARAAIIQLVKKEFPLVRGVDGDTDAARFVNGEPAEHGMQVIVENARDRVALAHP